MSQSWIFRVGFGIGMFALALSPLAGACKGKDCADERIGQKRCVGNRLETCGPNNELIYDSCTDNPGEDKYCSPLLKACVTKEIFDAQTASVGTGAGGAGGATAGTGGSTASAGGEMMASSSSDAASSSAAMSSSAATGGGDLMTPLNGCNPNNLTDYTAPNAAAVVTFGNGFSYAPPCIKVKVGQTVTFLGINSTFAAHPIAGGLVDANGNKVADPTNPVKPTNSGTQVDVTFGTMGAWGFYCEFHAAAGMKGAVYVVP